MSKTSHLRRGRTPLFLSTLSAFVLVALPCLASAQPFGSFSPRAMGMGGALVAAGTPSDAAFGNPALLSSRQRHGSFALVLPTFTARATNARDYRNKVDAVKSAYNAAKRYVPNCVGQTCTGQQKTEALNALSSLNSSLTAIDGEPVSADVLGGASVGIPGHDFGVSLFADSRVVGGAVAHYASQDRQNIATAEQQIRNSGQTTVDPSQKVYSTANFRGAMVTEFGIAMAHRFGGLHLGSLPVGDLSVGFTPKFQRVRTVDYTEQVNRSSFSLNNATRRYSDVNFDAGVADRIGNDWRVALAGHDLSSKSYRTAGGHVIHLKPAVRAGVSRSNGWLTLTADYDLTTNGSASGLTGRTRFLDLGAEMNAFDVLQLRLGYEDNTASGRTTVGHALTAGVGFRVLGVHFDVAALKGGNDLGGAFQAGVDF